MWQEIGIGSTVSFGPVSLMVTMASNLIWGPQKPCCMMAFGLGCQFTNDLSPQVNEETTLDLSQSQSLTLDFCKHFYSYPHISNCIVLPCTCCLNATDLTLTVVPENLGTLVQQQHY